MENPFKNFSQKDWLYVGGAVASIVALGLFITYQRKISVPSGTQSDIPNNALPAGVPATAANYLNYNTPDYAAPPIPSGADIAPDVSNTSCNGCGCDRAGNSQGCTGPSPLSTGDTFSGLDSLLTYYQNTNPVYVELQKVQLAKYSALFATGESYSRGGTPLGVSYEGP